MADTAVPETAHDAPGGVGHVVPLTILVAVFLTLVVLTIVTVTAARVNLGSYGLYVALAIAGVKASLVLLYFMHLRYDRPFNAMILLACLVFVVLFISLAMTDSSAYHASVDKGQAPGVKQHKLLGPPGE
jgi:cytochrome c oxidase subunit 4